MIAIALALALQDSTRLTLPDAVRRALDSHPSVAAARAVRDRARADVGDARGARLPRLVLEGSATRYQEPMLVYPLHGFPTAAPAPAAIAPTFDRTLIQGSALLSWTLVDFGQRAGRVRASRLLADVADAARSSAELVLMQRTAVAYLRVLTTRRTLEAQDQRLSTLSAEAARIGRLLAEGKAARIEQLRVDAERARGEAERVTTAGQLEVAEHELAQLIGAPAPAIRGAAMGGARLRDTAFADSVRENLTTRARAASTDVAEARGRAEAARAVAEAVRATRLPELRASAGIVDRGRGSGGFQAEWQAGIGVSYALWTGGSRGHQIRASLADARAAAERARVAELAADQQVDRALAAVREARARAAALRVAVAQSEEVARIERTALEVGSGTQTDYLASEAELLCARANLIEAVHAEIAARIELARLTGELSVAWLAATLESVR